jgi:ppGpp synthetase/RelA/SpoT-type nucleotidyltranferase
VVEAGSYAAIATAYEAERPRYERLAALIAKAVGDDLEALRMEVVVQHRSKDVRSFVKKTLRKGYTNPLKEIGDKAGVRVIVHYKADVETVVDVVSRHCLITDRESKLDALEYDQLGYLGVHLAVTPRDTLLGTANGDLSGLSAEVQIHTKAQSAWAVVSHDQLYKSPLEIPSDLKRTIMRLVALVELFDDEVVRFQQQLKDHPDSKEMKVLEPLDDLLVEFTSRRPDKALSAMIVPTLVRLYDKEPETVIADVVRLFVEEHREQLESIYRQYEDDTRASPLLYQPEALLIFATLSDDPYRLREAWPTDRLPVDVLESMANIWGLDLDEPE